MEQIGMTDEVAFGLLRSSSSINDKGAIMVCAARLIDRKQDGLCFDVLDRTGQNMLQTVGKSSKRSVCSFKSA
jgi:hypothetical protein